MHHWMTTDADVTDIDADTRLAEVACIRCGVTTAEWQYGAPYFISVDHGPLPLGCPGPEVRHPHVLGAFGDEELQCHFCAFRLDGDTLPSEVEWECSGAEW